MWRASKINSNNKYNVISGKLQRLEMDSLLNCIERAVMSCLQQVEFGLHRKILSVNVVRH